MLMDNNDFLETILEQPRVFRKSITNFIDNYDQIKDVTKDIKQKEISKIILSGMGSSLFACYPFFLRMTNNSNIPIIYADASELIHFYPNVLDKSCLLILVSQSGESFETCKILEMHHKPKFSISITNGNHNYISNNTDFNINTFAGFESDVSTKTYTSSLVILDLLSTIFLREEMSARKDRIESLIYSIENLFEYWQIRCGQIASNISTNENFVFVGRGYSLASARMGALIFNEVFKKHTAVYSGGQFNHGPIEIINNNLIAVVFSGNPRLDNQNNKLLSNIVDLGGGIINICTNENQLNSNIINSIKIINTDECLLPIIEIIPIQLLTIPFARKNNLTPGKLLFASKITKEE